MNQIVSELSIGELAYYFLHGIKDNFNPSGKNGFFTTFCFYIIISFKMRVFYGSLGYIDSE